MFDNIKGYAIGLLTRWGLKIAGGWLLSLGYSSGETSEIVAGAASLVIGIAISLYQHIRALKSQPPAPPQP